MNRPHTIKATNFLVVILHLRSVFFHQINLKKKRVRDQKSGPSPEGINMSNEDFCYENECWHASKQRREQSNVMLVEKARAVDSTSYPGNTSTR